MQIKLKIFLNFKVFLSCLVELNMPSPNINIKCFKKLTKTIKTLKYANYTKK